VKKGNYRGKKEKNRRTVETEEEIGREKDKRGKPWRSDI
jgi:hypothetical protein